MTIEEIKNQCSELENQIIDLYLTRKKQKEICQCLNIKRGKIDHLVRKYKLTRFRDRKNFSCSNVNLSDPKFWYFLGVFASDGNMYTCSGTEVIQFTMKDKDVLQDIKNILGYTGTVQTYNKQGKIVYFLKISDTKLLNTIKSVFNSHCHTKTFSVKFPKISDEKCLKMFLRGFLDGDGSYAVSKKEGFYTIKVFCASLDFCQELYHHLCKITDKVHLYKKMYIDIGSYRSVYQVLKYLYGIYPEIGIKRKTQRAMQHITNYELEI